MTDHRIARLLEGRAIEEVEPEEREILAYWGKARRAAVDSRLEDLSIEGAFDRAYQAAFLLATALVYAAGYRVRGRGGGHHVNTFYALGALGSEELARSGNELDGLRSARHGAMYDPWIELDEADVRRLRTAVERLSEIGKEWLTNRWPDLTAQLP